jgi:DNA repair ATPase RecN
MLPEAMKRAEETMSNVNVIQEAMEQAVDALEALPTEEWTEWLIYLLERLEEGVDDEEYRVILEALRLAITTRLEEGLW